jgi:hypothetical protein
MQTHSTWHRHRHNCVSSGLPSSAADPALNLKAVTMNSVQVQFHHCDHAGYSCPPVFCLGGWYMQALRTCPARFAVTLTRQESQYTVMVAGTRTARLLCHRTCVSPKIPCCEVTKPECIKWCGYQYTVMVAGTARLLCSYPKSIRKFRNFPFRFSHFANCCEVTKPECIEWCGHCVQQVCCNVSALPGSLQLRCPRTGLGKSNLTNCLTPEYAC